MKQTFEIDFTERNHKISSVEVWAFLDKKHFGLTTVKEVENNAN